MKMRSIFLLLLGLSLPHCIIAAEPYVNLLSNDVFQDNTLQELANIASSDCKECSPMINRSSLPSNLRGKYNLSPLFFAAKSNNLEVFKYILSLGIDPNVSWADDSSIIHFIAAYNDSSFISAILDNGGNPNITNTISGETPIFSALINPDNKVLLELVLNGAKIDVTDNLGRTPLMKSATIRAYDKSLLLIESGANCELKDELGDNVRELIKNAHVLKTSPQYPNYSKLTSILELGCDE